MIYDDFGEDWDLLSWEKHFEPVDRANYILQYAIISHITHRLRLKRVLQDGRCLAFLVYNFEMRFADDNSWIYFGLFSYLAGS